MPADTKLLRSGQIAGLRRVYISWLEPSPDRQTWIAAFTLRVSLETAQKDELFADTLQTGDIDSGDLLREWLDPKRKDDPITDVVGVLTDTYVFANTDRRNLPAAGELAQFFDRVLAADRDDRLRVFLAPVDPPNWTYRVRKVVLGDPDRANAGWLVRLRDDQFPWPNAQNGGVAAKEIAAAVSVIVDKLDLV